MTHSFPTRRSSDLQLVEVLVEQVEHLQERHVLGDVVQVVLLHRALGGGVGLAPDVECRSEEHTSELQSLMRISYAVFCLKKNTKQHTQVVPTKCTQSTIIRNDQAITNVSAH